MVKLSVPRDSCYNHRFAEEILNTRFGGIINEINDIIATVDMNYLNTEWRKDSGLPVNEYLSTGNPILNKELKKGFKDKNWKDEVLIFPDNKSREKMDFMKEKVGIEVQFGHQTFLFEDLLKFQSCSYFGREKELIDVGIYITATKNLQKNLEKLGIKWSGSLSYEKVIKTLPLFKSSIQVPIYVMGIDIIL
jgi:hypothetical protein